MNFIKIIIVFTLTISIIPVFAQDVSSPYWTRVYGERGDEECNSVVQTPDGGYLIAGNYDLAGLHIYAIWLVKIKPDGSVDWQKTYSYKTQNRQCYNTAESVLLTPDGSFVVAGNTNSYGSGSVDAWLLKLRSDGTAIWQKCFGGPQSDAASEIIRLKNGDFVLVGGTKSFGAGEYDFWVLRLKPDGSVVWQKTFGEKGSEIASSVVETEDGGIMVTGRTLSYGSTDIWVLRLDAHGKIIWQKRYGSNGNKGSDPSIAAVRGGEYVVAGATDSFGAGKSDVLLLKIDGKGTILWQHCLGGREYDGGRSIQQTSDGGLIVTGLTASFGRITGDIWILKLDSAGGIEWQKCYGGSQYDSPYTVIQTSDLGYMVTGVSTSFVNRRKEFIVLKLDADGACTPPGFDTSVQLSDAKFTAIDTSVEGVDAKASEMITAATGESFGSCIWNADLIK